jgi:hypothetical protein
MLKTYFAMALTTISVYKRIEGNNTSTGTRLIKTPATEGFETANVLWFGPSVCGREDDPTNISNSIVSKIILKGVERESNAQIILYTNSTVTQIAALS